MEGGGALGGALMVVTTCRLGEVAAESVPGGGTYWRRSAKAAGGLMRIGRTGGFVKENYWQQEVFGTTGLRVAKAQVMMVAAAAMVAALMRETVVMVEVVVIVVMMLLLAIRTSEVEERMDVVLLVVAEVVVIVVVVLVVGTGVMVVHFALCRNTQAREQSESGETFTHYAEGGSGAGASLTLTEEGGHVGGRRRRGRPLYSIQIP